MIKKLMTFGRGLFIESNIGQKSHNHSQGKSYGYFDIDISKINHDFNPFLNLIAVNKHTIPSVALTVNTPNFASVVNSGRNDAPRAIINQAADKLTSKSDNVTVTTGSNLLTENSISQAKWVQGFCIKIIQALGNDQVDTLRELLVEGYKGQQYDDQNQAKNNHSPEIPISNNITKFSTIHVTPKYLFNWIASNNANIANNTLAVNINQLIFTGFLPTAGTMKAAANHPADKLINQSATDDRVNWSIGQTILYLEGEGKGMGVGTTNPIGALHVVGQCVSGDTKLRRRRRRKSSAISDQLSDENLEKSDDRRLMTDDYIWEDIRIDQIQPGDERLTSKEQCNI